MKVKEGNKQRSPTVVIPNDCFAAAETAGTGSGFTKTITCGMHTGDEKMLNLTGLEMDTSQEGLKMRKHSASSGESDKAMHSAEMEALGDNL